ncbi:hypothetical protein AALP_AA1G198000 [Arabis alpina]|uniref:Transmembrane protein n=1 Tax=Arabis alpina TaxID=50452 RepID=A0A087HPB8_ARAAL|nr:hypothetical protein AALP_AA1G198000 [Arabis alpina]
MSNKTKKLDTDNTNLAAFALDRPSIQICLTGVQRLRKRRRRFNLRLVRGFVDSGLDEGLGGGSAAPLGQRWFGPNLAGVANASDLYYLWARSVSRDLLLFFLSCVAGWFSLRIWGVMVEIEVISPRRNLLCPEVEPLDCDLSRWCWCEIRFLGVKASSLAAAIIFVSSSWFLCSVMAFGSVPVSLCCGSSLFLEHSFTLSSDLMETKQSIPLLSPYKMGLFNLSHRYR